MDALTKVNNEIEAAKEKRRKLIVEAFDGRTQKFISEKTGVDEIKLSRWVNGFGILNDAELKALKEFTGVDLK